jgi:2TM domain
MSVRPEELRQAARKRLEDRRGFIPHLLAYVLVNTGLIAIWATTAHDGFFWPGFVLGFWGIGVVMHAWNAFFSRPITETDVEREIQRLSGRSDGTRAA